MSMNAVFVHAIANALLWLALILITLAEFAVADGSGLNDCGACHSSRLPTEEQKALTASRLLSWTNRFV
jgi:hypothetical protein